MLLREALHALFEGPATPHVSLPERLVGVMPAEHVRGQEEVADGLRCERGQRVRWKRWRKYLCPGAVQVGLSSAWGDCEVPEVRKYLERRAAVWGLYSFRDP